MFVTVVAVVLLAPAEPPKAEVKELSAAAKKEVDKLQGKWKLVKGSRAGKEYEHTEGTPELIVEFKGRTWLLNGVEKAEIVALDPSSDPKCLDLKSLEQPRGANTVDEGIFKLDGDTLTICWYQGADKNRPTSFDIPKDKDTILGVPKRVPADPKK
ncbi:TIGR03067 domain-containing protein [Gemmata sp. JC673]|uniref:TIGR03067 domain-containing protein n=1 Tax=Gemmata algarum TaxID=2975278 RepID=A0ABU5F6J6_9BACT|nr:TIGR03067 domain-containing protein [Gemmata algarum]MDY3562819.1 TIGR03067 domain-containing protein [Gemmata algarum]